jgi:hypothetical protein
MYRWKDIIAMYFRADVDWIQLAKARGFLTL